MKKQQSIEERFKQGDKHNDLIRGVARQFAEILVAEAEHRVRIDQTDDGLVIHKAAGREPGSDTERIAREASDEYDRVGNNVEHISNVTREGALSRLAREVNTSRSFDGDEQFADDTDSDAVLDTLAKAVRDRSK